LRHTHDLARNAFSRGLPEHGAELADDLERLVQLHGADTIAARQPAAAATRHASTFGSIPPSIVPSATHRDYAVLSDPLSNVAEAYRGLAATSIATDRLPKAIMVSTPHGDAHEEVAANYAAALSRFGLKVALIATTPDQAWYAERFDSPHGGAADHASSNHGGSTFPELLVAAHAGTLDGRLSDRLASDDRAPNLVVVPPSSDAPAHLPVDGRKAMCTTKRTGADSRLRASAESVQVEQRGVPAGQ